MNSILPFTGLRKWLGGIRSHPGTRPLVSLGKRAATRRTLRKGESLVCVRGVVWLTTDRHGRDLILQEGERYTPQSRDRIVIEALEDSALRWIAK